MELDILIDDKLTEGIRSLAERHYGDIGEASQGHVVDAALRVRLLSLQLVSVAGTELDEPAANWEFASKSTQQLPSETQSWLFKERCKDG